MKNFFKVVPLIVFLMALLIGSNSYAVEIPGDYFYIQSAQEYGRGLKKGFWDIPGRPKSFKKGQNIQVWALPNDDKYSSDRAFRFRKVRGNVYEIVSRLHPYSRVDVAGGKRRNGANILLWKRHGGKNQRFKMSYRGGGKWKIYPMIGGVICLKGRSSKNNNNVHIWNDHRGPWTEWVLIKRGQTRAFIPKRTGFSRKPVRNSSSLNLSSACVPDSRYRTRNYFSTVKASTFSRENSRDNMSAILNRIQDSKRPILVQDILKATANNPYAVSRLYIYKELNRANIFRSSSFLVQMVIKQVEKQVQSNYLRERNGTVKTMLRQMKQKF